MSIEPCPFESTKRSRSGQPGLAGLWRRWSFQSTSEMSAIPIGIPGWAGVRALDGVHRERAHRVRELPPRGPVRTVRARRRGGGSPE